VHVHSATPAGGSKYHDELDQLDVHVKRNGDDDVAKNEPTGKAHKTNDRSAALDVLELEIPAPSTKAFA
jgi:hypothetical protein